MPSWTDPLRLRARKLPLLVPVGGCILAMLFLEAVHHNIEGFTTPAVVLFLTVSWAAVTGGIRLGLLVAVMAVVYDLHFYSTPRGLLQFTPDSLRRLIVLAPCTVANAFLVGFLKEKYEKATLAQANAAILASETKFQRLFESSIIGILFTNRAGDILDANEAFLKMLGYTRDDLLAGLRRSSLTPREYHEQDDRALKDLLDKGATQPWEKAYIRKDGARVPVIAGWASADADRETALCFVLDISELKQAEHALHELSGRLLQLQDEERRRIARELHDSTAQNLAALTMNLTLALDMPLPGGEKLRRALSDSHDLAQTSLREIRTLSYLLHPPLLDELGLASALKVYVDGLSSRGPLRVELELPPNLGRMPVEVETTLFRLVQESLNNVLRHSGSDSARVSVRRSAGQVELQVADMGCGIESGALSAMNAGGEKLGVGIRGMRERARQLGGQLEIRSNGGGVTVRAALPLNAAG